MIMGDEFGQRPTQRRSPEQDQLRKTFGFYGPNPALRDSEIPAALVAGRVAGSVGAKAGCRSTTTDVRAATAALHRPRHRRLLRRIRKRGKAIAQYAGLLLVLALTVLALMRFMESGS